jgi:hypothetical protein
VGAAPECTAISSWPDATALHLGAGRGLAGRRFVKPGYCAPTTAPLSISNEEVLGGADAFDGAQLTREIILLRSPATAPKKEQLVCD